MTKPKPSEAGAAPPWPTTGGAAGSSELGASARTADLGPPVAPSDLEELARWVPQKEMKLLVEICERAGREPDLARPALLLCSAYAERIARMLDQDPFPTVTRRLAERLRRLRDKTGL